MVFVLLCVFCLVLLAIKYILHVRHVESYLKNVKSISPRLPLIGNVKFFVGKSVQNVVEDGVQVILQNETPMKAQIGPVTYVIVDRPEDMQTVLSSTHCLDKPYIYDFFYAPTGLINNRCKQNVLSKLQFYQTKNHSFCQVTSEYVERLKHELCACMEMFSLKKKE